MVTITGYTYLHPIEPPLLEEYGVLYHSLVEPAVKTEYVNYWYKMGKLHRENGPAIDCLTGPPDKSSYWINDVFYTPLEYSIAIELLKSSSASHFETLIDL